MKAITKVQIIGAGNVATHLAKALFRKNIQVEKVFARNIQQAEELANSVQAQAISDLTQLSTDCDLSILAVKDGAIPELADQLTSLNGIVAHTAGSVSLEVLSSKLERAAVFYPLQTFSKEVEINFSKIPLCIEAKHESDAQSLQHLASLLTEQVHLVSSEQRQQLHVSAVFVCNFVNYLYHIGDELMEKNQLPFEILKPLIEETARKIQSNKPKQVQTGPAVRNDQESIKKHMEFVSFNAQYANLYKLMSDMITNSFKGK